MGIGQSLIALVVAVLVFWIFISIALIIEDLLLRLGFAFRDRTRWKRIDKTHGRVLRRKTQDGLIVISGPSGMYHVNFKTGKQAYEERFESVNDFSEGLAAVSGLLNLKKLITLNQRGYHIRPDGSPAYEARYARVFDFHEGRAVVVERLPRGDGTGFTVPVWFHIQQNGRPAYQERYEFVGDFKDGRAIVEVSEKESFQIRPDGTRITGA